VHSFTLPSGPLHRSAARMRGGCSCSAPTVQRHPYALHTLLKAQKGVTQRIALAHNLVVKVCKPLEAFPGVHQLQNKQTQACSIQRPVLFP
jgi:hypothetical protein